MSPGRRSGTAAAPEWLLFDAESLLIDPRPGYRLSLSAALADLGVSVPARWLGSCWGSQTPIEPVLRAWLGDEPARLREALAGFHAHYAREGRFHGVLRPGAEVVIAALARSVSEVTYFTHIGAEAAARLLDTYGLRRLPRTILSPELPECPGLRIALIEHAAAEHQGPEGGVLLSDHPWELRYARRLGLRSVGLGYGRLPLSMLRLLEADAVAACPEEVVALLAGPAAVPAARTSPQPFAALSLH